MIYKQTKGDYMGLHCFWSVQSCKKLREKGLVSKWMLNWFIEPFYKLLDEKSQIWTEFLKCCDVAINSLEDGFEICMCIGFTIISSTW